MNDNAQLNQVANTVAAFAQAVTGETGRSEEFRTKTRLVVAGARPTFENLYQYAHRVQEDGVPILWICLDPEMNGVPMIGLVARIDNEIYLVDHCVLWSATSKTKAKLVPVEFNFGAFTFDDDLQLTFSAKAPRKSLKAGRPGIEKALVNLHDAACDQLIRGEVYPLPFYAKAA